MYRLLRLTVLVAWPILWCMTGPALGAYSGPDDPLAIEAARQALARLDADRGALSVKGKEIAIVGLVPSSIGAAQGLQIQGASVEVNKALTDLGAKQVDQQIRISLSGDVLFDFDKWDVRQEAEEKLAKLAGAVSKLQVREIRIEGHTDAKGSEAYNLKLSQRRAEAIRKWLEEQGGLQGVHFVTVGFGETKPVAPNTNKDGSDNPEGRAKNRRVEITVLLKQDNST